ncbi:hypothetical protein E0Z10_g10999 [Xylaria hypoxylon]|uniref:C2H2-type domain-containing protein n=1 Tax=Xylaria hypoxylon TaxID=37992 RepID=A0A4Z0YEC5_9PEZI|nr:hypothetical protein E0Z10_g10999 [Xylaria hypoxylon]
MSTDAVSVGSTYSYAKEPLQSLVCPKCNVKYPNTHELLTHQGSEQHFTCNQCLLCFWTEEGLHNHMRKDHRPDLDLECFGCQSHFNGAGEFWKHLESGQCKVIFPSDIARLRDKNLEFATQLELRKVTLDDIIQHAESHIKGDDTWASEFEGNTEPAELTVTPDFPSRPAPILAGNAHPLYYRREDFPGLPMRPRVPNAPSFREIKNGNVWSTRQAAVPQESNSTPMSFNAVPPPNLYDSPAANASNYTFRKFEHNSQIQAIRAPTNPTEGGPHGATSSGRIVDPGHPNYNPAVFHNEILEKFVCPYKSCGKKFHNAFALTKHLESPVHTGGRISCICCRKIFTTVAALVTHMETATRCPIRETDGFRRALGQITGGIMDFHIRSGIFFINQNSVQDLLDLRSESAAVADKKEMADLNTYPREQQKQWRNVETGW